jgi:iron complex outermembrane receptor protein
MRTVVLFLAATPAILAAQSADSSRVRRDTTTLETVTVSAIRARQDAPVSASTLDAGAIEQRSFGQDIPLLLQGMPSLTSYAETGSYWGYSYMRLRGIDQSRINLTIDGVPLNDPEDQVLYFADFPDLANSIGSIQVQRGVGTSAPGTASYGGSINFQTLPLFPARRGGQLQLQAGSFGSTRGSLEYSSGLIANRVAWSARASAMQSAGYRHQSGTEGRSAFLSAAYLGDRDMIKLIALAGLFADTLAYIGATRAEIDQDRRTNALRPDEVDRFGEQVAALSYTRQLARGMSLATTVYRTSASGQYDVCISACDQPVGDLWNFNLDFTWYGATVAWSLDREGARASIGANSSTYQRDHHAYARPDLAQPLYFNTGHKDDASAFGKVAYDVGRLTLFGDVQVRHARFAYTPDANAGIAASAVAWSFINPKAGLTLRALPGLEAYASIGGNAREPARADMLGGFDNLDTSNVAFVGSFERVRPERARDLEAGVRLARGDWGVSVNAFAMAFRNEILPVGRLTYIGTPLRSNVRSSWRRGIEADVAFAPTSRIRAELTATAMRARIAEYTDEETGARYANVEPLLSPRFTSGQRVSVSLTRSLALTVTGQFTSRSQLDNTGNAALTLPSSYVAGASAEWTRGAHAVALTLNNATNARGFGGGHVSAGEARYYVLPPRNAFLIVKAGL